jgi:hypothetical protein
MYPHTANSLGTVFAAGVPFMIYHLISGIFTFTIIALPIISFLSSENKIEMQFKIKNAHKIPVVVIALCLIVLSFTGTAMKVPEKSEIWLENSDETSVKIVVIGEGWRMEDNIFAFNGDTVFSILEKFCSRNDVSFEYEHFEEFDAVVVRSIKGDEVSWMYFVNDMDNIIWESCDKYKVSNGDILVWRSGVELY